MIAGVGGRLGTGSSLSTYIRKMEAVENVELDEDPREALLKYAKVRKCIGFPWFLLSWLPSTDR